MPAPALTMRQITTSCGSTPSPASHSRQIARALGRSVGFTLSNSNAGGTAEMVFTVGVDGDLPVAGN